MNTITDHILSRRSVRSFSNEQIRDEDLDLIL
ncbi:nitroreductase, partial [Sphaerochaeta sp. S2]|nr:nitroreductase [Sphaerochaeta sp. S2]MBJ2357019.1 nitroreductase [Sphaerochaeta sp. S2]